MRHICLKLFVSLFLCFAGLAFAGTIPYVQLQPVIVQNSVTPATVANDVTYAQAIFAQIGLNLTVFTPLTSATLPTTMDASNTASNNFTTYLADSTWQPYPVLTAWYVDSITPCCGIRGVSFEVTQGPYAYFGIGVAASHAPDTLAHEIAHILTFFDSYWQPNVSDVAHSTDPNNLLASGSIRNLPSTLADIGTVDQIQPIQTQAIFDSPFVQAPEPVSVVLIGSGFAAVGVLRRRRAG